MLRLLLYVILFVTSATAETVTARVTGVHDGDTVTLLTSEKAQIKVRLSGIDAPESKQPFGQRSKQVLSYLVFGKEVRAEVENQDRYGRFVAWLFVGDVNVNEAQVRAGMAWWYRAYGKKAKNLQTAEAEARAARVGLWLDPQPVPPWEWRSRERSRSMQR